MHSTRVLRLGARSMASTKGGMRRILYNKKELPPVDYIRRSVEAGTYRSNEEIRLIQKMLKKIENQELDVDEYDEYSDDPRQLVERFKENFKRGTAVWDYPPEYHILSLNPPIPEPPKIPKKTQRKIKRQQERLRKKHGTTALTQNQLLKNYMRRKEAEGRERRGDGLDDEEKDRDYYQELFGIPTPDTASNMMATKSAFMAQAYAFTMKQYEIMRTQDNVTEEEALEQVEELLREENKQQAKHSRDLTRDIQQWRKQQNAKEQKEREEEERQYNQITATPATTMEQLESGDGDESEKQESDEDEKKQTGAAAAAADNNSIPSVFKSKPRVVEGMIQWSQKLQAVPYREWTVGASTALDHWVARNILEMEEETWAALLEGGTLFHATTTPDETKDTDYFLASQGRDLIAVRSAIFPETARDENEDEIEDYDEGQYLTNDYDSSSNSGLSASSSLDDLLASLRGQEGGSSDDRGDSSNLSSGDVKIDLLTDELQEWRQKNVELPYEQWSQGDQTDFMAWLRDKYVATLLHEGEESVVDLKETREALLASPPVTREGSKEFWDSIQDEIEAEIFLQQLHDDFKNKKKSDAQKKDGDDDGPVSSGAAAAFQSMVQESFLSLPFKVQVQQLCNLGSLRNLLDEYSTEEQRQRFLIKHGDALLDNVMMEHLISDPNGSISLEDIGPVAAKDYGLDVNNKAQRFRIEMLPYGTNGSGNKNAAQRSRAMYYYWNQHKANRARYEETRFRMGKLGFRYGDEPDKEIGR